MHSRSLYQTKKTRISLTALIDVVFILLLFFMLTSSFHHWKALDLTVATAGNTASNRHQSATLLLTKQAGLIVNDTSLKLKNYQELNAKTLQGIVNKQSVLVLLPHKSNQVQTVINALQHLKSLGFNAKLGASFGDELLL